MFFCCHARIKSIIVLIGSLYVTPKSKTNESKHYHFLFPKASSSEQYGELYNVDPLFLLPIAMYWYDTKIFFEEPIYSH